MTRSYVIDTPFGPYEPRVPGQNELDRAARVMGEAVEAIAKVNHDKWAAERIALGWHYGVQRDDAKKLHPDLIPYDQLSEEEKRIDVEGAKAIVAELLRLGIVIPHCSEVPAV